MAPDDELSEDEDEDESSEEDDDVVVAEGVLVRLTCAVVADDPSAGSLPAAIWM
jgi:hypothetical protein